MDKTRHLSPAEYYAVIQREYLIAKFKKSIYYSPKDKAYYQRVMDHKFEKINSIAKRNKLDSIFNSDSLLNKINRELFDRNGKPKFELSDNDLHNYYATGNEFSFRGEVWLLDQVNSDGKLTLYSLENQIFETAEKEQVCRIL